MGNLQSPPPNERDEVGQRLAAAQHLLAVGSLAAADLQFRAVLALEPNHGDAHAGLAVVLTRANHLDEAEREADAALATDSERAYYHYVKGQVYSLKRDWEGAERVLSAAIVAAPTWGAPFQELAWIFTERGHLEAAEVAARRALELRPDSVYAHVQLGHILLTLERSDEALPLLEIALRLEPQSATAHDGMARYYLAVNQLERAEASARESLALQPGSVVAHCRLASVLLLQKKYEDALAESEIALSLEPRRAYSLYTKGHVLACSGQPIAALLWLEKAMEAAPDKAGFYTEMSRVANLARRYVRAELAARCALKLESDAGFAWVQLGYALYPQGRIGEAQTAFEAGLKCQPPLSTTHNGMGWFYLQQGEPERAVPLLRRALELRPDNELAQYNLQLALEYKGKSATSS